MANASTIPTAPAPASPAGTTNAVTLTFVKEKDTKNCVRYQEQERPGQPKIIGTLYVQNWAAGPSAAVKATIEFIR